MLNILSFLHPNFFYTVYSYNFLPLLRLNVEVEVQKDKIIPLSLWNGNGGGK